MSIKSINEIKVFKFNEKFPETPITICVESTEKNLACVNLNISGSLYTVSAKSLQIGIENALNVHKS